MFRKICLAGTQRWNNVYSMLIQRQDFESTLNRRCFNVVCPLGRRWINVELTLFQRCVPAGCIHRRSLSLCISGLSKKSMNCTFFWLPRISSNYRRTQDIPIRLRGCTYINMYFRNLFRRRDGNYSNVLCTVCCCSKPLLPRHHWQTGTKTGEDNFVWLLGKSVVL